MSRGTRDEEAGRRAVWLDGSSPDADRVRSSTLAVAREQQLCAAARGERRRSSAGCRRRPARTETKTKGTSPSRELDSTFLREPASRREASYRSGAGAQVPADRQFIEIFRIGWQYRARRGGTRARDRSRRLGCAKGYLTFAVMTIAARGPGRREHRLELRADLVAGDDEGTATMRSRGVGFVEATSRPSGRKCRSTSRSRCTPGTPPKEMRRHRHRRRVGHPGRGTVSTGASGAARDAGAARAVLRHGVHLASRPQMLTDHAARCSRSRSPARTPSVELFRASHAEEQDDLRRAPRGGTRCRAAR